MDLVPTDAEVAEAERIYKTAYDADFGRGYGMRRALESFLQGRAKPAPEPEKLPETVQPVQEEITDADLDEKLAQLLKNSVNSLQTAMEKLRELEGVEPRAEQFGSAIIGMAMHAAIRASKGEKT